MNSNIPRNMSKTFTEFFCWFRTPPMTRGSLASWPQLRLVASYVARYWRHSKCLKRWSRYGLQIETHILGERAFEVDERTVWWEGRPCVVCSTTTHGRGKWEINLNSKIFHVQYRGNSRRIWGGSILRQEHTLYTLLNFQDELNLDLPLLVKCNSKRFNSFRFKRASKSIHFTTECLLGAFAFVTRMRFAK